MKQLNKKQETTILDFLNFINSNESERITIQFIRRFLFSRYANLYKESPTNEELFEMTHECIELLPYEGKSLVVEKMWKS